MLTPEPISTDLQSTDTGEAELEVVYQDKHLIAINKPAGLLVHRSAIDFHEPFNARDRLQAQTGCDVFTLHRLDKPTSGVLLFAQDKATAALTAKQFQNQQVSKYYVAVVRGFVDQSGTIDHPVKDKDAPQKPRKEAQTKYQPLAQIELPVSVDSKFQTTRYSVVQVRPLSGRRHQIRLHMKHMGHPLVGDTSYGKSAHNRFFSDYFSSDRLLLHAERLELSHPHTGAKLTILASRFDKAFERVLGHSDWKWSSGVRST